MKKQIDGQLVKFTFDDGVEPYTFDCGTLAANLREFAVPFGMSHRLGDAAAIPRKGKDGKIVTVTEAMRREAVAELGDYYAKGATDWDMRGGTRAPAQNPTILAIAAKRGCTYAEAEAFLAAQFLDEIASA